MDTLREILGDTKVLEALLKWLPTDTINEAAKDIAKDYDIDEVEPMEQ